MRHTSTILSEIDARLAMMRQAAGAPLLPPLLMLGTMERVGSNWLSDTLRVLMCQHNEPLRQQLAPDHPLSPLNPDTVGLAEAERRLTPYGRHWLVTAVVSKYDTTRQVIKETNLFFALSSVLELFPHSPVVVLTRSPLGVASSFARGGLFSRWGYRARYQQMVAATRSSDTPLAGAAALVPDDDPADLVALVRLHVLNTVLLATALDARTDNPTDDGASPIACLPYEGAVRNPVAAWRSLVRVLPELAGVDRPQTAQEGGGQAAVRAEDTFVTTAPKTALTAHLDDASAELVRVTTMEALATAQRAFPPRIAAQAGEWLAGDHLYKLIPPSPRPASSRICAPSARKVEAEFVPGEGGLRWRNLLVTNAEFAAFLNEMAEAGLPNSEAGTYLLCCKMPHERGGRLHRADDGRWAVSPGFEDHPAYWVTWIGAAAFAARHGARLPRLTELARQIMAGAEPTNTDYRVGDTVPVVQDGVGRGGIHHLVGNVQVWCGDGPDLGAGPAAMWLGGAAWNTSSTVEEVVRRRHRQLAGSSRGVGIRLVRDSAALARSASPREIAAVLHAWMEGLAERDQPLPVLDGRIVSALDLLASQSDVGLGAHVGAGFGEPCLGQLGEAGTEPQRRQVGDGNELHAPDRVGVGPFGGGEVAAGPRGLEGDVHDVGVAAGQVVAQVQQPADADVDAGLLPHLPRQRVAERFALLDLSARQGPGAAGVGVLVQQQNPVVLDEDAGHPYLQHLGNVPQPAARQAVDRRIHVVIAAGGLGTRVATWARYLPKEWLPVDGRPGIVHVLQEIAGIGPAHVVVVYHPYYELFAAWARQVLVADAPGRYARAAGRLVPADPPLRGLQVEWVAQDGCYADLTSVLNGADHLAHQPRTGGDELYLVFGDNLYPSSNALAALRRAPAGVAVLARDYGADLAEQRGVIITTPDTGGTPRMVDLVEKPDSATARTLQARHGSANLKLLEGRARLDPAFVAFAREHARRRGGAEPKLSLALRGYARTHPVWVVPTSGDVVDLGAPATQPAAPALPRFAPQGR